MESSGYLAKCFSTLKELKAPLEGWECIQVIDHETDNSTCELCGCTRVRYEHVMQHQEFPSVLGTGCICAGIMEDDILKAKKRERQARLRTKRKLNYLKKPWFAAADGRWGLRYKRRNLVIDTDICRGQEYYRLEIDGEGYQWKDNKRMLSFLSAQHFAFDLMDDGYA